MKIRFTKLIPKFHLGEFSSLRVAKKENKIKFLVDGA